MKNFKDNLWLRVYLWYYCDMCDMYVYFWKAGSGSNGPGYILKSVCDNFMLDISSYKR